MSVESALYSYLGGVVGVTGALGSGTAMRIYPDLAPSTATYPYATYFVVSTPRSRHYGGPAGIAFVRLQVDVWAASATSRRTVTDALRAALDGFVGDMGTELLVVRRCAVDGPAMSMERPEDATQSPVFRARLEVEISHLESIPVFA